MAQPEPTLKIIGERFGFLAEEVDLMALVHQCAAQILDVDVAPGVREHVPVGHDQLHDTILNPRARLNSTYHSRIVERAMKTYFEPATVGHGVTESVGIKATTLISNLG